MQVRNRILFSGYSSAEKKRLRCKAVVLDELSTFTLLLAITNVLCHSRFSFLHLSISLPAFFDYKEDAGRFPNPPSYNVATTLPSYDEAERTKAETGVPLVPGRVVVCLSSFHSDIHSFIH